MTPLVVVAAGGLAREVVAAVRASAIPRDLVVVDDDPSLWGTDLHGARVVGPLAVVVDYPDHEVVVCAGHGRTRQSLVRRLSDHDVAAERYGTVVHPSVSTSVGSSVGAGSIVLANAALTVDVRVERHVVVMPNVTLTHDVVVADFATVCAGVSLGGAVRIGPAAYLGMNASVRQGVNVGDGATLGMGGVLLEDLPPGETWAGVPAGPIGARHLQEV